MNTTTLRLYPFAIRLRHTITVWRRTARTRCALARASADQLRDVGLTRVEATREAARPFWQT